MLAQCDVGLQAVKALGHFSLALQFVQVGVQLPKDVPNPGQVLPGIGQAVLGLAAPLLVFGDAGSLFEKQPQLFGLGFDDAADRALADDGVGARPQASAQKHVLNIAPSNRLVVDVVAAVAIPREHALDRDLSELAPLPAGAVVGVIEHQFHAGAACRLAGGGAVEDHILHRLATQFTGPRLAKHPAHRVHDVGFAAAVRAHHAHQLPWQQEIGGFSEGLEPGQLDRIETHSNLSSYFNKKM